MTRNALTDLYLDEIARRGITATEVPDAARRAVDLMPTSYKGKCLSRPGLLERAEVERLEHDLRIVREGLASLPRRLFGGDLGAFARAAGMSDAQVAAVQRAPSTTLTSVGRADIYHDGTGFRLMELNLGANLGGLDNAALNPGFLAHEGFAEIAAEHGLTYVDSIEQLAASLLAECDVPAGERPFVVVVDLPQHIEMLYDRLVASGEVLAKYGVDVVPAGPDRLRSEGGRLWLDGHDRPVDVIYRLFLIEELLHPDGPAILEPVLAAAERGEVRMFAPLDAELYGSKAALSMLSDEANRHVFTAEELAVFDRFLPWTRLVREGDVHVGGELVDLREYLLERREDLVLKPAALSGGQGVALGWRTEPEEWAKRVQDAFDSHYVAQARLSGVPERFDTVDGEALMLLNWCVFTGHHGYAGAFVRGSTDLSGGALNSIYGGATLACVFHQA
ncbi:MAG TPA: hypothetical protein VGD67_02865 [Pseudonocardiaceae bacterium]